MFEFSDNQLFRIEVVRCFSARMLESRCFVGILLLPPRPAAAAAAVIRRSKQLGWREGRTMGRQSKHNANGKRNKGKKFIKLWNIYERTVPLEIAKQESEKNHRRRWWWGSGEVYLAHNLVVFKYHRIIIKRREFEWARCWRYGCPANKTEWLRSSRKHQGVHIKTDNKTFVCYCCYLQW